MVGADPGAGRRPFVVALTGGIAAGKSVVAERFQALGVAVYDADTAAREVVAPGTPALAEIVAAFGASVVAADGSLRRRALRELVFARPAARRRLEAITHPRIRAWLRERVRRTADPYCIVAVPLLVKHRGDYAWTDRVLVVDVPEATQIQRLVQRDGISEAAAARVLEAQASRVARLAIADDVLVNDGNASALDAAIATLHERYLTLAVQRANRA